MVLAAVANTLADLGIHGDTFLLLHNLESSDVRLVSLTTLQTEAH